MKCMCAQTRPRFILSSEGVLGGMEFEPMLTPREKSPLPENVPRGGSNPRHRGQRARALPTELFRPPPPPPPPPPPFGINLKGMCISFVSSERRSHEPETWRRVPIMTEIFPVTVRNELNATFYQCGQGRRPSSRRRGRVGVGEVGGGKVETSL